MRYLFQIIHRLRALGVGPDVAVGVRVGGTSAIIANLAISLSGGTFVPLPPFIGRARAVEMASASGVTIVLIDQMGEPWPDSVHLLQISDALLETSSPVEFEPAPNDLMYVMFTSGTTRAPRGVAVRHSGVSNRVQWLAHTRADTSPPRVMCKTPLTFDVSVWEWAWPLSVGGTAVVVEHGQRYELSYLHERIRRDGVDVIHFVPSLLD